ncbi:hypothetical protein Trydic_g8439 [Trypoxylus dichotomus]
MALRHLLQWCGGQKLQISTTKTTYALLKGRMQRNSILKLDDRATRRKNTTRYLGIHVGERENYAEHIKQVCNKATATMHKIARMARKEYHIPLLRIQGYMSFVMITIVNYGASAWANKAVVACVGSRLKEKEEGRRSASLKLQIRETNVSLLNVVVVV